MESPKTIYQFKKNSSQIICSVVCEFNGKPYLDLRVHYRAEDGQYRPTKKGIRIDAVQIPELKKAIGRFEEAVNG